MTATSGRSRLTRSTPALAVSASATTAPPAAATAARTSARDGTWSSITTIRHRGAGHARFPPGPPAIGSHVPAGSVR